MIKYFNKTESKMILEHARKTAQTGKPQAIREYLIIHLLLSAMLRSFECAALLCGDISINNGNSKLIIRHGKGNKYAEIPINSKLKEHLRQYLEWKIKNRESVKNDAPLILNQRNQQIGVQGIQFAVKKILNSLGLYTKGKSCHSLRHSGAMMLYSIEKDLYACKRLLRHSNISTTTIYAQTYEEDVKNQIERMW